MTALHKQPRSAYFLHVILPLIVGGLIYVTWRSKDLWMFSWFAESGLSSCIDAWREIFSSYQNEIPEWVLYSLPDGLWVYSFSMYMGLLWRNASRVLSLYLMLLGPCLGFGGEIGQAIGLVPGIFDPVDLNLIILASIMALQRTGRARTV